MRVSVALVRCGAGAWIGLGILVVGVAAADSKPYSKSDKVAAGWEIFNREWLPGDPRSHGGDGLGPVYNDTSCVACHNAGGPGGAGPISKNIDILNASRNRAFMNNGNFLVQMASAPQAPVQEVPKAAVAPPAPAPNTEALVSFHAGFRSGRTVVLHKFGTDPGYDAWRRGAMTGQASGTGVFINQVMGSPVNTTFLTMPPTQPTTAPVAVATVSVPDLAPPVEPVSGAAPAQQATAGTVEVRAEVDGNLNNRIILGGRAQQVQLVQSFDVAVAMPVPQAADAENRAAQQLQQARLASQQVSNPGAAQPQMPFGEFTVTRSQRNPTPLFGLGLIDEIPEKVIEEAAARRFPEFPEVQGRVSRLKDGRVGRLGWKGQTANSEDFVLTACAVELGLEVPGHNQAIVPQAPKYKASGLDLTGDECASLVAYVRSLPKPDQRPASTPDEEKALASGKAMFAGVGCASCHSQKLGNVDGIFSDLLLHDMGAEMAESGSYNGGGDDSDDSEPLGPLVQNTGGSQKKVPAPAGARKQEWRTPPLWGFRDSGPYLHDGRAQTLDQAIALHGGQGAPSAQRFFKLSPKDRQQVEAFLKSLVAPAQLARAGD